LINDKKPWNKAFDLSWFISLLLVTAIAAFAVIGVVATVYYAMRSIPI